MIHRYFVNGRFVTQALTGVQRYCYEISLRLRNGTLVTPRPALREYRHLQSRLQLAGGRLTGHTWEQLALPWAIPRRAILFSPAGCGPIVHHNQVITIHDVACLEHPEWYSRGYAIWYTRLWPVLSRRVRKIVTVSEFCRQRIVELLRVPEDKVVVAGEAAEAAFSRAPGPKCNRRSQSWRSGAPISSLWVQSPGVRTWLGFWPLGAGLLAR